MIAVILTILMTLLFGSMFLMLWFGFRNAEEERAASRNTLEHLQALDGPRFFAKLESCMTEGPATISPELLIQRLEDHVRKEQSAIIEFVQRPTMNQLHRGSLSRVEVLAMDLERRIRHDIAATSEFFVEPTVEGLFRDLGYAVA